MTLTFAAVVAFLKKFGGWVGLVVIPAIIKFYNDNKAEIQALTLRIQKDAADGLTEAEMEQLAVDLFFEKLYPKLPIYVKWLPNSFFEKKVRKIVKEFCEHSHILKGADSIINALEKSKSVEAGGGVRG